MNATSQERTLTAVSPAAVRSARWRLILVGLVIPVGLTAIVIALIVSWLPELPTPVATHWGPGGVDGFGPPQTHLWLAVVLGIALPALLVAVTLAMGRQQGGGASRLLGSMALGLSGFSAVANTGSVAVQRGLTDAHQAGEIWPIVIGGFLALLALTGIGWLLQPHIALAPAKALPATQLEAIAAGERVTWIATASLSKTGMAVIGAAVVLVAGITAVMAVRAAEGMWIPVLTLVIIGFAFASSASFRVRAGADGLTVRSQLGVPRVHVPLEEIVSARAVQCHPFGEFGGFGWRIGLDGRTGIVLRTGPAIEVERRGKRPLVVTVDGAEVGVATLQAYLNGRQAHP